MADSPDHSLPPLRLNPLVPAALLFLAGAGSAVFLPIPLPVLLSIALAVWLIWLVGTMFHFHVVSHVAIALLLTSAGANCYLLNQTQVEPTHIARFTGAEEIPVTLRLRVIAPPAEEASHGPRRFLAHATALLTNQGWIDSTGDIMVSAASNAALHRGDSYLAYGWLSRPEAALNPGARDERKMLAADRIFAELRVPRQSGLVPLEVTAAADSPVARFRLFLRGKLLEHTLQKNVPAAYTLTAILLGHRDPAIAEVSQSFADAGIAHLLAISGSHIVFFAAVAWFLLRLVPFRPRTREIAITLLLLGYVSATPAGPPILRAAAILFLALVARLLTRPRQYLNLLAAAALFEVLLRPADIADAGFQLTFVTTAALILFTPRLHDYWFRLFLAREAMIADFANTRAARLKLRAVRLLAALISANLVGAVTATPLVAYHFGQINPWAPVTGLIALPIVYAAMIAGALQLALELLAPVCAGIFSPLAAGTGQLLIRTVHWLAAIPFASIALRPPPGWVVLLLYGVLAVWLIRPTIKMSRAAAVNGSLAAGVIIALYYALSAPVNHLRITAFHVGQASAMLVRMPTGDLWAFNAGSPQNSSFLATTLRPALQLEGSRRINGSLFTALDAPRARHAADLLLACRPASVYLAQSDQQTATQTLAGSSVLSAAAQNRIALKPLMQNQSLQFSPGCTAEILWPPTGGNLARADLILLLHFAHQSVLIADPASLRPLAKILLDRPALHADAILFTGPQRGDSDDPLRQIVAPFNAARVIWSGRGSWSAKRPSTDLNTADGAITIDISAAGLSIEQLH